MLSQGTAASVATLALPDETQPVKSSSTIRSVVEMGAQATVQDSAQPLPLYIQPPVIRPPSDAQTQAVCQDSSISSVGSGSPPTTARPHHSPGQAAQPSGRGACQQGTAALMGILSPPMPGGIHPGTPMASPVGTVGKHGLIVVRPPPMHVVTAEGSRRDSPRQVIMGRMSVPAPDIPRS